MATISSDVGFDVHWTGDHAVSAGEATGAASSGSAGGRQGVPQTVAQMKSLAYQAGVMGFLANALVTTSKGNSGIFKIQEISDDGVRMIEIVNTEEGAEKSVSVSDLISDWKVHKSRITSKIEGFGPSLCTPMQAQGWLMDGIQGAVALAMQAEWKLHASHLEHQTIFTQPTFVRVEKAYKPQGLILVGASMRLEKHRLQQVFTSRSVTSPLETSCSPCTYSVTSLRPRI